jgi:hypothetical protein
MSARVKHVMTTRIAAVRKNAPFKDIVALLTRYRVRAFPSSTMTARSSASYPEPDMLSRGPDSGHGRAGRTARAVPGGPHHDEFARAAARLIYHSRVRCPTSTVGMRPAANSLKVSDVCQPDLTLSSARVSARIFSRVESRHRGVRYGQVDRE